MGKVGMMGQSGREMEGDWVNGERFWEGGSMLNNNVLCEREREREQSAN